MQETYSLHDFQKFIYDTTEYYNVREKIFSKNVLEVLDKVYIEEKITTYNWNNFLKDIFSQKAKIQVKTNKDIYILLKEIRKSFAEEEHLPLHCIFSNKTLEEICKVRPRNMEELKTIQGIKDRRADKYGEKILEVINM